MAIVDQSYEGALLLWQFISKPFLNTTRVLAEDLSLGRINTSIASSGVGIQTLPKVAYPLLTLQRELGTGLFAL